MSFFNPSWLFFLPLAALPIIIHLLGKRRLQVVEFSALRFLRNLENEVMRRLKLRQILLLILRTLLVLVIILSLARPYRVRQGPDLGIKKGQTLIIILDNSASMQLNFKGVSLFDYALEQIKAAAAEIEFPVNLKIITLSEPQNVHTAKIIADQAQLTTELARVKVTNFSVKPVTALQTALTEIQKQQEFNASIWVASDFQISNWHPVKTWLTQAAGRLSNWRTRLILIPIQQPAENIALREITFASQILTKDEPVELRCYLENWVGERREVSLNLFLENERVGQNLVQLKPFSKGETSFEFIPLQSGELSGYAAIADDFLKLDNHYYFVLSLPEAVRVLLVSPDPNDVQFISKALTAAGKEKVVVNYANLERVGFENLANYDLLITANIDRLSPELTTRLETFLSAGGKLMVFLGDKCNQSNYNAYWSEKWHFPRWHQTNCSQGNVYQTLGSYRPDHPLFKNLWLRPVEQLGGVHFYCIPELVVYKNQQALLYFSDQTPFIIENEYGILVGTLPINSWTDWQFSGLFPTLILRMVQYLTTQMKPTNYVTGDSIIVNQSVVRPLTNLSAVDPAGRRFTMEFDQPQNRYVFRDTNEPGIYSLYAGAELFGRIAVNLPLEETAAGFWTRRELSQLSESNPRQIAVVYEDNSRELSTLSQGQEYAGLLLGIALVLAFGEAFLARSSRSKL